MTRSTFTVCDGCGEVEQGRPENDEGSGWATFHVETEPTGRNGFSGHVCPDCRGEFRDMVRA